MWNPTPCNIWQICPWQHCLCAGNGGTEMRYSNFGPGQPTAQEDQCVSMSVNGSHHWSAMNCGDPLNDQENHFICQFRQYFFQVDGSQFAHNLFILWHTNSWHLYTPGITTTIGLPEDPGTSTQNGLDSVIIGDWWVLIQFIVMIFVSFCLKFHQLSGAHHLWSNSAVCADRGSDSFLP